MGRGSSKLGGAGGGLINVKDTKMTPEQRVKAMNEYTQQMFNMHANAETYQSSQMTKDAKLVDEITKNGDKFTVWSDFGFNSGWQKTGADKWERWTDSDSTNVTNHQPITTREMVERMNNNLFMGRFHFSRKGH